MNEDTKNYVPMELPPNLEKERAACVAKGKTTLESWDWGYKYAQHMVDNLNKNVREGN